MSQSEKSESDSVGDPGVAGSEESDVIPADDEDDELADGDL